MKVLLRHAGCVSLAAALAFVGGWFAFQYLDPYLASGLYSKTWWPWLPASVELAVKVALEMLSYSPVIVAPLWLYHQLTFRRFQDGNTYCGNCRGLLKRLKQPECPGCGQPI